MVSSLSYPIARRLYSSDVSMVVVSVLNRYLFNIVLQGVTVASMFTPLRVFDDGDLGFSNARSSCLVSSVNVRSCNCISSFSWSGTS